MFTGYSSLAVALALPAGGRLYALDRDPKTLAVAQRYWDAAGVADKASVEWRQKRSREQQLLVLLNAAWWWWWW